MSPEERRGYDRYVDAVVQETDVMETAHNEGRETGRLDERKALVSTRHRNGMSVAQIAQAIDVSESEIERLLE